MPNWEIISQDSARGIRRFLADDSSSGDIIIRTEINDSAIIERNMASQNDNFDRSSDMWHAASIPTSVMFEWLTQFGVNAWNPDHASAVKKLLNSSDYRW
jgi:hypothetical protein